MILKEFLKKTKCTRTSGKPTIEDEVEVLRSKRTVDDDLVDEPADKPFFFFALISQSVSVGFFCDDS